MSAVYLTVWFAKINPFPESIGKRNMRQQVTESEVTPSSIACRYVTRQRFYADLSDGRELVRILQPLTNPTGVVDSNAGGTNERQESSPLTLIRGFEFSSDSMLCYVFPQKISGNRCEQ